MRPLLNKKITYLYNIHKFFIAGIKLKGYEVKSLRRNHANISAAYISVNHKKECIIHKMHISRYPNASNQHIDTERSRQLLLKKREILYIASQKRNPGTTFIPMSLYFTPRLCKIKFAQCTGKNLYDKRRALKAKDLKREKREY